MADRLTQAQRSALMSRVRTRDTSAEMYVRQRVWRSGFRYRLAVKSLSGRPDMVLPRFRTAVFVHGCFWHGHDCPKGRRPSSNRDFWNRKLDGNIERDKRSVDRLEADGWSVSVIWECELKSGTEQLLTKLGSQRREQGSEAA
ncbi:MAG: DNA mismatch endonuclease Vsr [Chloroflexi bacterium]|nr:DNA mismatch endonuclease Vsr [Chloroflexota bacterium]MYF23144.1 DNA mismatch endonuclease Vsr [Chloroflexota bacterium]